MRSELQYVPVNPAAQSQVITIPGPSRHVPPLRQVSNMQNARSISHPIPVYPSGQAQLVPGPNSSTHVPPLRQVVRVQEVRPVEQFDQLKPSTHILTCM